ncbi:MAG: T9SS type A sorting domain-containing protein [Phaeodactylibacter sp.]|nr:T9SS type A sorting domain-containing protein [Phaeodactylibacter sp.]
MRKKIFTLSMAVVCTWSIAIGQSDLATWGLTSNGTPTFSDNNIQASHFIRGNGVTDPAFGPNGATSYGWETINTTSAADYFEVCINPKPNNTLTFSGLQFTERRNAEGIRGYQVMWSKDGFQTSTLLSSFTVPDDLESRDIVLGISPIKVCQGETLCLRWYAYAAESNFGEWTMSNIVVKGTTAPTCAFPVTQASNLVISNITGTSMGLSWTRGNGTGVLVVARAGAPVDVMPCYITVPGVSILPFGLGTKLGENTFVVYSGPGNSTAVSGLEEGETYHFAVIEFNDTPCFRVPDAPTASATTLCTSPGAVTALKSSPAGGMMYLAWDNPNCFDEIMIVASENPITAVPTSMDPNDYTPGAIFGTGTDAHNDFSGTESPVYRGTGNRVQVTGLTNGQLYYFQIFTFRSGVWQAGAQISATPEAGCSGLGDGGRVFFNEIHFANSGGDVDEGFELVGTAGIDLENYVILLYPPSGQLEKEVPLSGLIDDEGNGYGAVWVPVADIFQIGGVALFNLVANTTVEFLSWRADSGQSITALDGLAIGASAVFIGVSAENGSTPFNYSLQRIGNGTCPGGMSWQGPMPSSRGAINIGQALLPIELISFTGELVENEVLLSWQTATEENNDYMAVEHSTDARQFTEIGRLKGAGTTLEPQSYQLWHQRPQPGINYYRLRQVDFDGQTHYHGTVAVEYKGGKGGLVVYPTITSSQIVVELSATADEIGELVIFNLYGQAMQSTVVPAGSLRQELSVAQLPAGHYLLQWRSANGQQAIQRFVKL